MGLNGLYGITAYLPETYFISLILGQAFSGIFMNIVRYFTLYFYFDNKLTPEENIENKFYESLIYYSAAIFICLVSLILCFVVYKDEYFQKKLKDSGEFENLSLRNSINSNNKQEQILQDKNTDLDTFSDLESESSTSKEMVFCYLWDLNALICINFFLTFIVYPGAALENNLL